MPINKTNADGGNGYGLPEYTLPNDYKMGASGQGVDMNTELSEEQLEVRKMGAGYELVFWKDGSKSLRKGNSTWGNLVRGISHLTNEIERLNKAISEAKKAERSKIIGFSAQQYQDGFCTEKEHKWLLRIIKIISQSTK